MNLCSTKLAVNTEIILSTEAIEMPELYKHTWRADVWSEKENLKINDNTKVCREEKKNTNYESKLSKM